ncbi:MAG: hypothetical protein LCI03_20470 [Actinobacteria bacterium]|nr:hypothetical protein [Actinomycetota bacterium]
MRNPAAATLLAALSTLLVTGGTAAWSLGAREVPPASRTSAAATVPQRCGPEPRDAAGWSALFSRLDGDWAGGDAALSVRLGDGRLLWAFGDSFVGDVRPDGSRAPGSTIVRNSVLVTDGTCVAAATPGRATLPARGSTWLWPTSVVRQSADRTGTTVIVFAQRMRTSGSGAWGFARVGAAEVRLRVLAHGGVSVGEVRDLPASDVLWGAASTVSGPTTYIYGTREVRRTWVMGRELLVARAPTGTVADFRTWSYRTASGWSRRAADAVAVVPAEQGVSTTPSVVRSAGRFRLVTKPQEVFDDQVVVMSSETPYGPWRTRTLFSSPSTGTSPTYSPTVVAAGGGTRAVVAVSRTSTSLAVLMRDASASRPAFYDVDLA